MSLPADGSNVTPGRVRMTSLPSHDGSAAICSGGSETSKNVAFTNLNVMPTPPQWPLPCARPYISKRTSPLVATDCEPILQVERRFAGGNAIGREAGL